MSKSHFDLNNPPPDEQLDEPIEAETSIVRKPSEPRLITLPLGLKVTRLQMIALIITLLAIITYGVLRNTPQSSGSSGSTQFVTQETPIQPTPAPTPAPAAPRSPQAGVHIESADRELEPVGETSSLTNVEDNAQQATAQALDNVWVYARDNREGLKSLDQRLRALEQQVAAQAVRQPQPAAVMPTAKPTGNTASRRSNANHSLKGASITSLYPDLAWVTYQGSSWALRPGDALGRATVLRIDTEKREVITSAGTIR
ncbi:MULTISPECIES: hypothetical protein [Serratia]|uniref:hypothetical protein n=1 Tax=Serratia TaxID=613 RepID=UPI00100906CF|nr:MULTISPECIES: hypothetical protein [Serratia]MDX6804238.1 hypothetical protein [Serratia marcescens]MDX6909029.1 hypothetical protein [Serratia marcescens]TXE49572.1 hypothetical protein FOT55_12640 [Serratia bockelmannii]WGZ65417.1 hypothetical protein SSARUM_004875 [Serratia sp. K-M0706]WRV63591.1 hypothetical protein VOT19_24390 [Serratia sp. K-M0228]